MESTSNYLYLDHAGIADQSLLYDLIMSMRPKQWSKNLLIFAGLLFSGNLADIHLCLLSFAAFAVFCLLAGAVYLINDMVDMEKDRRHPVKCRRPIASGRISQMQIISVSSALISLGLLSSFLLDMGFGLICSAYTLLMLAYTFRLKNAAILDVILIAIGFVLRAVAGAVIIHVQISPWLLVCTLFIALFLVLSKRRHEKILLGEDANSHRNSLAGYSDFLLDMMISAATACSLLSYTLYTLAPRTLEVVGTDSLVITIPLVIYGVFRYLFLVYQKNHGGSPEITIFEDKPLLINLSIWVIMIIGILYF